MTIDCNKNRTKNANGQEGNALEVNLGAADELARQLRLRDMGGIIVVDFIDMNEAENRQKLYERMCANMQKDRARHNILPLSKFGLMQITRQRVRPAMDVNTTESARYKAKRCEGCPLRGFCFCLDKCGTSAERRAPRMSKRSSGSSSNDIVLDVSDAIREKKSRAEINKIVAEWLE